jgi:hypothetical protein
MTTLMSQFYWALVTQALPLYYFVQVLSLLFGVSRSEVDISGQGTALYRQVIAFMYLILFLIFCLKLCNSIQNSNYNKFNL